MTLLMPALLAAALLCVTLCATLPRGFRALNAPRRPRGRSEPPGRPEVHPTSPSGVSPGYCAAPPVTALASVIIALLLGGCSLVGPGTPPSVAPPPPAATGPIAIGWTQEGFASWYGEPFHGRTTSSGEVYDMEGMTAAHRTLPFGTVVRVENLGNGKSATLRINDRGPFIEGRIIDLSRWAARELEMLGSGVAQVRVTIIGLP